MAAIHHLRARPQPSIQLQGIHPILSRVFAARGVENEQQLALKLAHLLPANQLLGLETAVTLIDKAIDSQQLILIVGDFDADGATSTALMMLVLRQMGANVHYLVPDRFKFGYGLTPEIVALALKQFKPDVIITVDNGISSHEGVAVAQAAGVKVIITDHHLTTKQPPPADAVVNPNQPNCTFTSKALAGVGVAFYVLASLATHRKQAQKSSAKLTDYLDLVALGTVADVAPLDYNNRILVANGLTRIQQGQCRAGLLALLDIAGRKASQVTTHDLGFILGPRINAAGRMDNMSIGIECLLAEDMATAQALASQLDTLNQERRNVEGTMKDEALQLLADTAFFDAAHVPSHSIVLFEPRWHQGVIGIVAGRLKEQFHRPSIVFAPADDTGTMLKGSARSIEGVHIRDAIEQVAIQYPDLISHFGGHAMAAGLSLARAHVDAFSKAFNHVVSQYDAQLFQSTLLTDGALDHYDFSLSLAKQIAQAGPWGQAFPAPVFEGDFMVVNQRILKDKHIKYTLRHPRGTEWLDAIVFNVAEQFLTNQAKHLKLAYQLDVNEYQGIKKVQLHVLYLELLA